MKSNYRVLILGSSDVTFSESGPDAALPALLLGELTSRYPEADWAVDSALLYPTAAMAEHAGRHIERTRPDAIHLSMGTNTFVERTVLSSIRHRMPWLYPVASRVIAAGKLAGGGRAEGHPGRQGLLFRAPRRLGRVVFGAASLIDPAVALAATKATFEILAGTGLPVVVRLAEGNVQQQEQRATARALTRQYNDEVGLLCRNYGFPAFHLSTELGTDYRPTPDGLHGDRETRRQGAAWAATHIGAALWPAAPPDTRTGVSPSDSPLLLDPRTL